jgi:adenine-specific DNA-methyltransferase
MRYIGSKASLLSEIRATVSAEAPNSVVLCDMFAGTGIVGREFKASHQVISNDILYFAYVINAAYIGLPEMPTFTKLKRSIKHDPIDFLNSISVNESEVNEEDFMAISYSPMGKERRQYLTISNALKIDKIRQTINHWLNADQITQSEFYYLLTALIECVPAVSNTTGTYGAFLKHWDKRALKPLKLCPLEIIKSTHNNLVFNRDANNLIDSIKGDILYLDTPYNGRQYSSNYHLLESLALYDQPALQGVTGTRVDNAGHSAYCRKSSVFFSYDQLLSKANFNTIVISYSSDGILSEDQLIEMAKKYGKPETFSIKKVPYRRYKRTANDDRKVVEYLIAITK